MKKQTIITIFCLTSILFVGCKPSYEDVKELCNPFGKEWEKGVPKVAQFEASSKNLKSWPDALKNKYNDVIVTGKEYESIKDILNPKWAPTGKRYAEAVGEFCGTVMALDK